MRLLIDSHLDLAWNALSWKRDITLPLDEMNAREADRDDDISRGRGTTCLPEMRRGGMAICLGTLLARAPHGESANHYTDLLDYPSPDAAHAAAHGQLAYYTQLERRGEVRLIGTGQELTEHFDLWSNTDDVSKLPIGIIIAMEGSDGIAYPEQAEHWYKHGLRCASLVHYGTSAYAVGTGFEGPLTKEGRTLLAEFDRLGIILDATHLSDTSFTEAMNVFEGPVMASHNNCRALVPGQRQFSDEQLKTILHRGGVIGLAFDAWMIYPGWKRGETDRSVVKLDRIADHLVHICELAGNVEQVAIGSDLDGGFGSEQTPLGLDSIADLQKLGEIFSNRGYSDSDLDGIFHGNWMRFFGEHLP